MAFSDAELAEKLREAGRAISDISSSPAGSPDELMNRLLVGESLLALVEQEPPEGIQNALSPLKEALISEDLVHHFDMDMRVTVASCITEILRISAPEAPFGDEQMKDIFRLTIAAFDCLSPPEGYCYTKAKSVLGVVSKIKSCVILLDLECNGLIAEILKRFFRHIGPDHPKTVFSSMETIMALIIDECDGLPSGVLGVLLSSVRKDTQRVSPVALKLGEKIITKYASFLEPYVVKAVEDNDILLDDYIDIVASIHQKGIKKSEEKNNPKGPAQNAEATGNRDEAVTKSPGFRCGFLVKHFTKAESSSVPEAKESLSTHDEEKDDSETERELNEIMPMPERYTLKSLEGDIKRVNDSLKEENGKNTEIDPENAVSKPDSVLTLEKQSSNKVYTRGSSVPKHALSNKSVESEREETTRASPTENPKAEDYILKRKISALSEEDDANEIKKEDTPKGMVICLKTKAEDTAPAQGKKRGRPAKSGLSSKSKKDTPKAKSSVKTEAAKRRNRRNSDIKVKSSTTQKKQGSKSIFKRARVIGKEEDTESPELGESLIGRSIMVLWPLDKMFYEGVVDSYDDVQRKHKIAYVDGDVEILNMKEEIYQLIEPGQFVDEGKTELDMLNILSAISPQDGKEDMTYSSSERTLLNLAKEAKVDLSLKRKRVKGYLKTKHAQGKQVKKPVGKKQAKAVSSSKGNREKEEEEVKSDVAEPAKIVSFPKRTPEKEEAAYDASMEDAHMIIYNDSSEDMEKTDLKGKEVATDNPEICTAKFGVEECAGKLMEMSNGESSNRWRFVYTLRKKKLGANK